MTDLIAAIAKFGFLPVALGVLIYIVLRGEFDFHYPRKKRTK
ncbi:MAG: hypothetical protein ABSA78_21115 [Candidatus Sulfotelmatobacter sp.]|jgi:hypothetical protein